MDHTKLSATRVLQCLGGYPKPDDSKRVLDWVSRPGHDASMLGPAEAYVHVLSATPHARLRLEILKLRCGPGPLDKRETKMISKWSA